MNTLIYSLIASLICKTKEHAIEWIATGPEGYKSVTNRFSLKWLHWYDSSGFSLDRRALVLSSEVVHIPLFNGTQNAYRALDLLRLIDPAWQSYISNIQIGLTSMNTQSDSSCDLPNLHDACLYFLRAVLESTRNGLVKWERESDHSFVGSSLANPYIKFTYLVPADYFDSPLGPLVIRLSISNATLSFTCGTDGFYLIEEILANAFDDLMIRYKSSIEAIKSEADYLARLT